MTSKKRRLTPTDFGDVQYESGANPDFKVTSATRQAREMEMMLAGLARQVNILERREARTRAALQETESALAASAALANPEGAQASPDASAR